MKIDDLIIDLLYDTFPILRLILIQTTSIMINDKLTRLMYVSIISMKYARTG